MKILFLTYVELFPISAGNRRRIVDMMDLMRRNGHDVYLLWFGTVLSQYARRKTCTYFGKDKCFFYQENKYGYKIRRMLRRNLNRSVYYSVDEMIPQGLLNYVREIQKKEHFDVAIAEYVMSSKVLSVFGDDTLKIIDTHDILTGRNRIFEELGMKPTGIYLQKRQEIRGLRRADVVLAIQNKEASVLKKWLEDTVKVEMVGNIVGLSKDMVNDSKKILFLGSGNRLNQNGAKWFINKVLPLIKDSGVKVIFAGKVCEGIADSPYYEKRGFVEDLDEIYNEVQIVVNPIQGGTGLNIKTIEALGYAKPLVSSRVGAKGLPKAERYMRIAETPEEFAQSIMMLIDNIDECKKLSKRAYAFMKKYNEACENKILKIIG